MSIKLNEGAYQHAKKLILARHAVLDARDAWSDHRPTSEDENRYIEGHGFDEYARWHLGIDTEHPEDSKARYRFPYGDLENIHRCAVLSAEARAAQYNHAEIQLAAAHLHGMLDALRTRKAG